MIGLPRRSGMVNAVGAKSCRNIIRHPPVGQCRQVQRPRKLLYQAVTPQNPGVR